MYFYRSKKQKLYDPELGQHVSFGIGVWKPFAARSGSVYPGRFFRWKSGSAACAALHALPA